MNCALENYIDLVRDIHVEQLPGELMAPLVAKEARAVFDAGLEVPPEARLANGDTHGRHLLWRDPDFEFVVVAMAWPAGADSQAHDHGTWGVVLVLDGELEVTEYAPPTESSAWVETGRVVAGPGEVSCVIPPTTDVHRIRAVGSRPALSLHVYGKPIERCRGIDTVTGETTVLRPEYDSDLTPATT